MTEPGGSWHVVFGATGAIGRAVVTELRHAGRDVRAVSRGGRAPEGAQGVAADALRPRRMRGMRLMVICSFQGGDRLPGWVSVGRHGHGAAAHAEKDTVPLALAPSTWSE